MRLKLKIPMHATPFNQIDGVLMSFFFFMGHSELHFNAETVYKKEIPDETFERREKFKEYPGRISTSLLIR